MTDTKMKPDWEDLNKQLDTYWATIDKTEGGHQIIKEIKPIIYKVFMKQEEQHKAEVHDYFMQVQKSRKDEFNIHCLKIERLKQQHRAELIGLKKKVYETISKGILHEIDEMGYTEDTLEIKLAEFNKLIEAITNLLKQKGE